MHKLTVTRCCPYGNKMGCQLWIVTSDSYSLGKFGTKLGAENFALGRANARALIQYRAAARRGDTETMIEAEIEVEE